MINKQKGLTLIEMLFISALIGLLAFWGVDIFYNQKKKEITYQEVKKLNEDSTFLFNLIEKNLKNDLSFTYQAEELFINNPVNNCDNNENTSNIYTVRDEGLFCNNILFKNNVVKMNMKIGYDTNNDGAIDTYRQNTINNPNNKKYVMLEFLLSGKYPLFDNKEYEFHTLEGSLSLNSNSIIQIYRKGFLIN